MRTFLMLYSSDFESDDDRWPYKSGKSRSSERRTFTMLSSVCSNWHLCLTGWPQSPTPHWVRHQLKKLIEGECTYTQAHTFVNRPMYCEICSFVYRKLQLYLRLRCLCLLSCVVYAVIRPIYEVSEISMLLLLFIKFAVVEFGQ